MDIEKAHLILSEAVDCYITTYPEKKGDIAAALKTIGKAHEDCADLLHENRQTLEQAGKVVTLQNSLIRASLRVYPGFWTSL